jgi:hypothetical protein
LQPQEVWDAASRLAFLALNEAKHRPRQIIDATKDRVAKIIPSLNDSFRYYDAVGPETMSMKDMLGHFARLQGNQSFRPVFIGYRNMERVLNIKSLGNLNRQFVSLLRSEQDAKKPIIGDPSTWEILLGQDAKLIRLIDAFSENEEIIKRSHTRRFPYFNTMEWILRNPKVILPGIDLSIEILLSFFHQQQQQ